MIKIEITIEERSTENGTDVVVDFTSRNHGAVSQIEAGHARFVIDNFLASQRCTPDLRAKFAYEFLFHFRSAGVPYFEQLPLGAIVAVCDVIDCQPTESLIETISVDERSFGDYTPGRFGWILGNVRRLEMPIFCRGYQGFFNVEDSLLAAELLPPKHHAFKNREFKNEH